jgi:hypothetical protein
MYLCAEARLLDRAGPSRSTESNLSGNRPLFPYAAKRNYSKSMLALRSRHLRPAKGDRGERYRQTGTFFQRIMSIEGLRATSDDQFGRGYSRARF